MDIEPRLKETSPDLAALLGSRICHDLISPLGAISNGLELLAMAGVAAGPEMRLIADSIAAANGRIRLFRLAFGAAGGEAAVSAGEIGGILQDMGRGGRTRIDWDLKAPLARREAKLIFLGLLCMETALPRGGQVTVMLDGQDWKIRAQSERLLIDRPLWEGLTGAATPHLPPAQVQFALLADEARRQGRMLRLTLAADRVELLV